LCVSKIILMIYSSLETYGANVDQLKAPVGGVVPYEEIERALKAKNYKIVTVCSNFFDMSRLSLNFSYIDHPC
jgi:hypothetical protein